MNTPAHLEIGTQVAWAWACLLVIAPAGGYALVVCAKGLYATFRMRAGDAVPSGGRWVYGLGVHGVILVAAIAALHFVIVQSFFRFHRVDRVGNSLTLVSYIGFPVGELEKGSVAEVAFVHDGERTGHGEIVTLDRRVYRSVSVDALTEGRDFVTRFRGLQGPRPMVR